MSPVKSRTHICFYRSYYDTDTNAEKLIAYGYENAYLPTYRKRYGIIPGTTFGNKKILPVENLIFGTCTLAQKLEYWFDGYKKQWRAASRES